MLLSVDPGLHGCGVAAWHISPTIPLSWAGYVKNPGTKWHAMVGAVDEEIRRRFGFLPNHLVIELPQVYVRSRSKGDPNDLIMLAGLVGAFVYNFDSRDGHKLYKPAEWKGQVPKDIMETRIKGRLSEAELHAVELPARSLAHNVWDAVGLGLAHLGRL